MPIIGGQGRDPAGTGVVLEVAPGTGSHAERTGPHQGRTAGAA